MNRVLKMPQWEGNMMDGLWDGRNQDGDPTAGLRAKRGPVISRKPPHQENWRYPMAAQLALSS